MANQTDFKFPLSIGGKTVPGRILIDYNNGNAEWFAGGDSFPTFKSSIDTGGFGKWGWTPATNTSVENLRRNPYLQQLNYQTDDALIKDFYTGNSIPQLNNQRAYAFNKNAPIAGKNIGVPGVRGTSGSPPPAKPSDPAPTAPGPSTTPSPDGPSSTPVTNGVTPTITQNQNTSMIAVYPLNMDKLQDRIKFTALEYIASGSLSGSSIQNRDRTSNLEGKKPLGHVFLPVQASITDTNSVDWQGPSLNEIERLALNTSLSAMNAPTPKQFGAAITKGIGEALTKAGEQRKEVQVLLAGEAVGVQNLLGRFGSVLNPNLELLFTGPQLRPFDFRFQMSAREPNEAKNIKTIINFFKKNMAPRTTKNNIFLTAPNTFLIEYKYKGPDSEHPGINKIKECALLNCSVDYTPLGTYMTYDDGTMEELI